jgi:anti-sigma regulatory factor (Ser/Thr protein kinase)
VRVHELVGVSEISQVGQARRLAAFWAADAGWNESDVGRLGLAVTEIATNLCKHARNGRLLLGHDPRSDLFECMSIDDGPGMRDVEASFRDGHSTSGSSGIGLSAIRRLAHEFDLHSDERGTVLFARIARGGAKPLASSWSHGAICKPVHTERACGDGWSLHCDARGASMLLVDGLGHGPDAEVAADAAIHAFAAQTGDPQQVLDRTELAMRGTRGGAVAVAAIDLDAGRLDYAGIGNISGTVIDGERRSGLVSHHGIVGGNMRKAKMLRYDWPGHATLVMHSDGLQSRWSLDAYTGWRIRHPAVVAGLLYRDFARNNDDVTVFVLRRNAA